MAQPVPLGFDDTPTGVPQSGIEPERKAGALHVGGGVGEDAKAARETLDAVEQQGRTVGQAGRDLGDTADLETRVGAVDAPQGTELIDQIDEFAQIPVHVVAPAV